MEEAVGEQLDKAFGKGVVQYENHVVKWTPPPLVRRYTPDFVLPNGIVIETKGRFVTSDRQKHKYIKEQYPDLDIRFVFSNCMTRISKRSKTTYGMWCQRNGFLYSTQGVVPQTWIDERPLKKRIAAINQWLKED